MPNDSSTGGYLLPDPAPAPVPLTGDALTDFFQQLVVGITGLPGAMVRPRWQPEAPDIPAQGVDWCGIGITKQVQDTFAAEIHNPTNTGTTTLKRHEILTILASFYGPDANTYASVFSDGLQVAQNREVLSLNNMGLVQTKDIVCLPTLMKNIWLYRYDIEFVVKRQIVRQYSVLNLLSSEAEIVTDVPPTTTTVTAS